MSGAIVRRHFDVMFGCLVFGLGSLAFQKITVGFGLSFFIGGGMDCSFLRLRFVFAKIFRRICANRDWVASLADNVMEYQSISRPNRTNAFLQYGSAQPIW